MSKNTVRNIGLCGGLSAENLESMREKGFITDRTSLVGVAAVRCVLCHFSRGEVVMGFTVMNDTRAGQTAYNQLDRLRETGLIVQSTATSPIPSPLGHEEERILFEPSSPELAAYAQTIPRPENCPRFPAVGELPIS